MVALRDFLHLDTMVVEDYIAAPEGAVSGDDLIEKMEQSRTIYA